MVDRTERLLMNNGTLIKLKPFLYGKLLGDGHLEKMPKSTFNSRFKVKHKVDHKEYVEQCFNKLHNFANKIYLDSSVREYKGIQKRHYAWTFKTKALPVFTELRKQWYKDKKVLPEDLEQFFTIETLAYWYLDDGCVHLNKSGNYIRAELYTFCFTSEEVDRLINIVKTFNIETVKCKSKHGFYIEIRKKDNVIKFFDLIREFVPKCMEYKIRTQH